MNDVITFINVGRGQSYLAACSELMIVHAMGGHGWVRASYSRFFVCRYEKGKSEFSISSARTVVIYP